MKTMRCMVGLLAGVTLAAGCGGSSNEEGPSVPAAPDLPFPGGILRADLTDLMEGRVPQVVASGDTIVAYSQADYTLGWDETLMVVSADRGRAFEAVPVAAPLSQTAATVDGTTVTLLGRHCEEPSDVETMPCEPSRMRLRGVRFDVRSPGEFEELDGLGSGAPGAVGHTARGSAFVIFSDEGRSLLTIDDQGNTTTEPLPETVHRVCAVGGSLIGVGPGTSLGGEDGSGEVSAVGRGDPLFFSIESVDGGASWGDRVEFPSSSDGAFSFAVGVACGPEAVVAYSVEMAVIRLGERQWRRLEEAPTEIGPGDVVAWNGPDAFTHWKALPPESEPAEEGADADPPKVTLQTTRVDLSSGVAERDPPQDTGGVAVTKSGAEAEGIFLAIGDGVRIGVAR
jgi:hypothetical protein